MEKTFGTALVGSIGVRHVGIARGMPDDMNTKDPFKTSEGFAFICVWNFKCSNIFSSTSNILYVFWRSGAPNTGQKWKRVNLNWVPTQYG